VERALSDEQDDIRSKLGIADGPSRGRIWIVLTLLCVLAGGVLIVWQQTDGGSEPMGFRTANVVRGDLRVEINATGTVEPTSVVEVSSELSGTIVDVYADYNDVVAAGDMLARLDTSKLEAQVAIQRANLRSAEARRAKAAANLDEASATAERSRALGGRGISSDSSVTAAEAALARAAAEREVAEADVFAARANLRLAETDLGKASIFSPVDGIVLDCTGNPRQTISAAMSAPVLFAVAEDLTEMELRLAVDEADIARLFAGQIATFEVDAHDDTRFPATVRQVRFAPEALDGVVTYTVILDIDNEDLTLRPGMTAVADIVVNEVTDALLVPNAALRFVPRAVADSESGREGAGGLLAMILPSPPTRSSAPRSSSTLWVLRNGEPLEIEIDGGDTDGRFTVIRGGVEEGDRVIVGQDG